MGLIIGIIGLVIALVIVYFNIPYSRLKVNFKDYLVKSEENINANKEAIKYTMKDLPQCMQNFYNYTGLMNKADSKHVSFDIKNADFVNTEMKRTLKIDYSEHIFADVPARYAFIDSSLFGIPFQGLDSFIDGKGGMKGVIAKNITIFDQHGEAMNNSAFVTWLSEIIFMPSQLLNGEVEIKEIDKNTACVTTTYYGITISGNYRFLDNGELVEFTTDDRSMIYNDGRIENKKWSALYEEYLDKDGLRLPNRLKAEWHLENENLVYFDGCNVIYKFY
jgi:hypothetical protein